MDNRYLVIMGPIAAGKGTHARLISEKYGLAHISPGQIFRDEVRAGTGLGRQVGDIIDGGGLVPDEITNALVRRMLDGIDVSRGFILDGYPRTINQTYALDEMADSFGVRLSLAIDLNVSEAEAVRRISGRFFCAKCGQNYHDEFAPPKVPGVCDKCGSTEFLRRADDAPEVIKVRFARYYAEFAPIIDFYRTRGILVEIDADALSIDEVAARIGGALGRPDSAVKST